MMSENKGNVENKNTRQVSLICVMPTSDRVSVTDGTETFQLRLAQ